MTEAPAPRAPSFLRRASGIRRLCACRVWALVACLLAVGAGPALAQAPAWAVTPSAFEQNMSVVAVVSVGGVRLSNPGDRVAAFVGTQVRGVAAPTAVGGSRVFFLPVYASTGGERVTFKAYDAAANVVRDLAQALTFAGNAVHGGATDPLVLTPGTTDEPPVDDPDADPWRVDPSRFARTMGVVGELRYADGSGAGTADRVAAFVGGEIRGVAPSVDAGGRRVFFLPVYANAEGEAVTFKVASGATVRALTGSVAFATDAVTGTAEAPHLWTVTGAGGTASGPDDPAAWTVAPSAFDRSMNVVAALFVGGARSVDASDRVAAFVGGEVRGVAAPREVGGAWLAFLTVYGRAEGEAVSFKVFDASARAVLPAAERLVFATNAVAGTTGAPVAVTGLSSGGAPEDPRLWATTPAAYEQSMSTVGALYVGGVATGAAGSRVAAFVRGSVRGVVGPSGSAARPLFFVPVYGGPGDGAVSYKAFDAATGRVYETVETAAFEANRVDGRVDAPFALHAAATPTSLFVYPGDANGDGRVTQNDLFPLSVYFGLRGPARSPRSLAYRAELVGAWSPAEASLADMNGDGQIDQNDLFALGLNFGRTRAAGAFSASPSDPAAVGPMAGPVPVRAWQGSVAVRVPTIRATVPAGRLGTGDTLRVAVRAEGGDGMRAAGFRLLYDAAVLEPLGRTPGALFAAALDDGRALEISRRSARHVSYAVTVAGAGAVEPDGEVVVLRFRVRPGAEGATVLRFEGAEAMAGAAEPVALASDSVVVRLGASTGVDGGMGPAPLQMDLGAPFPNPSSGPVRLRLRAASAGRVRVALYDPAGRLVAVLHDGVLAPDLPHVVAFDGAALADGVYVVRADAATGSAMRTVVLRR